MVALSNSISAPAQGGIATEDGRMNAVAAALRVVNLVSKVAAED